MSKETSKSMVRRLQDPRFSTVWCTGAGIDIGCGDDPLSAHIYLLPQVTGIRGWDLADGDAQYMAGVEDCAYDFAHSSNCLEHLGDPLEALRNWLRIIKPGGHLLVTVPDEDLYEQGVFPSTFNEDHKWTFTIYKAKSWSSRSINVFELLAALGPEAEVKKVELLDHCYIYGVGRHDQTHHRNVETFIEIVLRKRTGEEITAGGRLPIYSGPPRQGSVVLFSQGDSQILRNV